MSQQVQELINKIKSEGIDSAKQKASEIEKQAQQKAQDIIEKAQQEAEQIIQKAENESQLKKEKTENALKQSSRDMILTLKKEIKKILDNIIQEDVKEVLSRDRMAQIIAVSINAFLDQGKPDHDIIVTVSEKDQQAIKKSVFTKIKGKVKEGIVFRTSGLLDKGFSISFDAGKSAFDFSDQALAEYLSNFLHAETSQIIQSAVDQKDSKIQ